MDSRSKHFVWSKIRRVLAFSLITAAVVVVGVTLSIFATATSVNTGAMGTQVTRPTRSRTNDFRPKREATMNRQTRKAVSPGNWGGDGIKLEIGDDSSALQFACADGVISEKLFQDGDGNFSAIGSFTRRTPGPQREGGNSAQKASFVGRISGRSMIIKIMLTESKTSVGEFTLELDKKVRLQRCL